MTKAEIARRLAEACEKKPEDLTMYSLDLVSPLGFWKWAFEQCWQPFNPFTSEADNALLLEAMPNARVLRLPASRSWSVDPDWVAGHNFNYFIGNEHPDRKEAIVLAACRFKGI